MCISVYIYIDDDDMNLYAYRCVCVCALCNCTKSLAYMQLSAVRTDFSGTWSLMGLSNYLKLGFQLYLQLG